MHLRVLGPTAIDHTFSHELHAYVHVQAIARALEIERCCACHCHERKRKGLPFHVTPVITCACNGRSNRLAKVEASIEGCNLRPSVGTQAAAADLLDKTSKSFSRLDFHTAFVIARSRCRHA